MNYNSPELQPNYRNHLIARYQTTDQIGKAIAISVKDSLPAARVLSRAFAEHEPIKACKLIFYFAKKAIPYVKEGGGLQTAKTLPRILSDAKTTGGDCKHYTTTAASLCMALEIPVKIRLIGQNPLSNSFNHVYAVAIINGREFVIDPCLNTPGKESTYFIKKDIKP